MTFAPDADWHWRVTAHLSILADDVAHLAKPEGECVLLLVTSGGLVWLHTKDFYPEGSFRLPTGGIKPGEEPDAAARRELREEVGKTEGCDIFRLGRLGYRKSDGTTSPFVSHLYRVEPVDAMPTAEDDSEHISGWRTARVSELGAVAALLRKLPEDWAAWGEFRAAAHDAIAKVIAIGNDLKTGDRQ